MGLSRGEAGEERKCALYERLIGGWEVDWSAFEVVAWGIVAVQCCVVLMLPYYRPLG